MIPDATFTLAAAKAHLRVTHHDEDALIGAMLDAAVAECERITRRAWTSRKWSTLLDSCDVAPCSCSDPAVFHAELSPASARVLMLPLPPADFDPETDEPLPPVEIPRADYHMATDHGHSVLRVTTWPAHPDVGTVGQIDWEAAPRGGTPPPDIVAAVMLCLGDLYENREAQIVGTITNENPAVQLLLRSYVVDLYA